MTVMVRYFAILRDRAGVEFESIATSATTARELIDSLIERHNLGLASPLIRPAINGRFVDDLEPLNDGDEIALIPPVAGG